MIAPPSEQLEQIADELRKQVDNIVQAHADSAGLFGSPPPVEKQTLDDLAAQFQPQLWGEISRREIDEIREACSQLVAEHPDQESLPAIQPSIDPTILEKGKQTVDKVFGSLRQANETQGELTMRADALAWTVAHLSEAGRSAAQHNRLAVEQRRLLVLNSGLLETAKECLLEVVELLSASRDLLRAAFNLQSGLANSMVNGVLALTNTVILPQPPGPMAQFDLNTLNLLLGASNAYRSATAANGLVARAAAVSNQLSRLAERRLITCLALQALSGMLLQVVNDADEAALNMAGSERQRTPRPTRSPARGSESIALPDDCPLVPSC